MSLYAKGAWKRLKANPEELSKGWSQFTSNPRQMFSLSALVARALLLTGGDNLDSTVGINAPCNPRKDSPTFGGSQADLDRYVLPHLAANLSDAENQEPWQLPEGAEVPEEVEFMSEDGWTNRPEQFNLLGPDDGFVGFWLVCLGKQELEDKASIREDVCATTRGMPYKLVDSDTRKTLLGDMRFPIQISRKQVPVIVDLNTGDIWVGSASTKFVKAAMAVFTRAMGVLVSPTILEMGGTPNWVPLALNVIRDRDIMHLERQEAVEFMASANEEDLDADETEMTEDEKERQKEREEEHLKHAAMLADLAEWRPMAGRSTLVLHAEAAVALKPDAKSTVGTQTGQDALSLFHKHSKAELASCIGSIRLHAPTLDDKGDYADVTMEFSSELVNGCYKNLEFKRMRDAWVETLEEPYLRGTQCNSLVDTNLNEDEFGPAYNRYWFRYYLCLRAVENALVNTFAQALDLDPSLISVKERSLFAPKDMKAETKTTATPDVTETVFSSDLDEVPEA